jgi:uncharacterized membrane protein YfcA
VIWALLGAVCIGISLGLLGSGGSILTVPVLVYVLHHQEKPAMAESLAIVGSIALIGALQYALKKMIDWRSVVYFGVPGMAGSYGGAWLAGYIPGETLLGIFALFMLGAASMMLRPVKLDATAIGDGAPRASWKIAIEGLMVGGLTGLVGAGGGFLIVPALVLLGGLNMHIAIGTSLCIIAMKSATGFVKYIDVVRDENLHIDWSVTGLFIIAGAIGSVAGNRLARIINQATLRRFFGLFLIVMALYILISQAVKMTRDPQKNSDTVAPART